MDQHEISTVHLHSYRFIDPSQMGARSPVLLASSGQFVSCLSFLRWRISPWLSMLWMHPVYCNVLHVELPLKTMRKLQLIPQRDSSLALPIGNILTTCENFTWFPIFCSSTTTLRCRLREKNWFKMIHICDRTNKQNNQGFECRSFQSQHSALTTIPHCFLSSIFL